ncbi:DMT family transporter [Virgibacillus sp. W0181]|uniref:DMT family transporter n=1 Tax=Virgibacillus sp. W0181 TaxID=3391581 RepID=UPI003F483922
MDRFLTKKWIVAIIAVFCSILWGSAFPVLKVSYIELQMAADDTMAKIVFAGMRFFLAGIILVFGMIFINRKALFVTKKQVPVLVIFGIVQTGLQYFFLYNGLSKTSGMQGAILVSGLTFFTVILAHYFYVNDRMNWQKTIGLIAGFTGIVFANWGQEFEFSFQFTGEGFIILSTLTGAIGTIMAKELAVGIHPFALTGWQLTIGGALMLLVGYPLMGQDAMTFTPIGWGLLIYSSFLSIVAFALWFSLLKYNKAGEISIYQFVTPLSGAVLSVIFIPGERFTIFIIAALLLVVLGVMAVNYKPKSDEGNQ